MSAVSVTSTVQPTPLLQTTSQPAPRTDFVRENALRRQIPAEFAAMRKAIDQAAANDEMGKLIDQWQQAFAAAFYSSVDAQAVLDRYISLLQEILRDPLSRAPLDCNAILGSDGYTYSYMTLSVYLIGAPQKVRNRSPMHVDKETPFSIQPYPPVARHMVAWLQSRGACLHSEAQERVYKQLLLKHQKISSQSSLDVQTKISNLLGREKILDLIEKKEKEKRGEEFQKRLDEKLARHKQQLQRTFAPLLAKKTVQTENNLAKLDAIAEKYRIAALTTSQKLQASVNEEKKSIENLTEKLEISKTNSEQGMAEITKAIHAVSAKDQDSLQELTKRVTEFVEQGFEPFMEHITDCEGNTKAKIKAFSDEDQKRLKLLEASIHNSRQEIDALKKSSKQLKQSQEEIVQKIAKTDQQAIELEKGIEKTRIAILEVREREKTQLLSTLLQIGACALGTWVLQSVLEVTGAGMQVSLLPSNGGNTLSSLIKF